MSTVATPRSPRATGAPRRSVAASPRVLARLTAVEARLSLRDPAGLFFSLLLPAVILTVLGTVMPWADDPFSTTDPGLAGITAITGYVPTVLALAVGTVAMASYPTVIATYRGTGVLRRLSTTPLPPSRVLVAQLLVNLGALLVAATLALVLGVTVVGITLPADPAVTALAFVLTALSAFAVGSVVAALAPSASAANGYGMTVYFVSLFFAGVWLPLPIMPEVVQQVAAFTPLGAGAQAMLDGWVGAPLPVTDLVVMAVWTVVLVPLAARVFRWR